MKTLEEILKILRAQKGEIRKRFKAEVVGIFGSRVRGEERPGSDLDVLVRFLPGASLFDLVGLANFLEERLGLKVDVVPIDALRRELEDQVLREAVYL